MTTTLDRPVEPRSPTPPDEPASILGEYPAAFRAPNTTYEPNRICVVCPTILSVYNAGPWCALHEGPQRVRLPYKSSDYLGKR